MDEHADFTEKLRQIEEAANIGLAETADSGAKNCFRHIVLLTKTLRSRLESGYAVVSRKEPRK